MKDEIIDIEAVTVPDKEPTDKTLKLIDELNNQLTTEKGEWIYVKNVGICWHPSLVEKQMGHTPQIEMPSPSTPPLLLEDIVKWGNTIDFDNIPQNAVVLVKLDISDPFRVQMMQRVIAKQVLEPRIEKLKERRVCILFMQAGDDISVMPEEDMKKAGWEKKEKSIIITP
jgi:hypothetical protein